MDSFPWVIIGIVLGLVVSGIGVIVVWKRRKQVESQGAGYRALYILGLSFLPLGVVFEIIFFTSDIKVFLVLGLAFIALGLSYLSIGLGNKDKWNKQT
jgi:hypothetical protein